MVPVGEADLQVPFLPDEELSNQLVEFAVRRNRIRPEGPATDCRTTLCRVEAHAVSHVRDAAEAPSQTESVVPRPHLADAGAGFTLHPDFDGRSILVIDIPDHDPVEVFGSLLSAKTLPLGDAREPEA